jgi:hypothetical protein
VDHQKILEKSLIFLSGYINMYMLKFITDITDPLLEFIKDDPVRPEIPVDFRVSPNRFVSGLIEGEDPQAMVCVSLCDQVPSSVAELTQEALAPTTAIFYTIWSYAPGAGKELLMQTVDQIKEQFPNVTRFVTLSPKSEMARRFHLKNGAEIFRENDESINYEYQVLKTDPA